jgi:hypothetical protein
VEKAGFASFNKPSSKMSVKFKRPPRTSREAILTLSEADKRYESSKSALFGRGRSHINEKERVKSEEKREF